MSMYQDVVIAGFGGQGVMFAGDLLAYASMLQDYNVTFIPVYGPEIRGGTANCTVVISDDEIGSPIIHSPTSLIIMNLPSLEKFQPRMQKGGTMILNSSLVDSKLANPENRVFPVPVNDLADKLGTKAVNMVALGAYIQAIEMISIEAVKEAMPHLIKGNNQAAIAGNEKALDAGAQFVRES